MSLITLHFSKGLNQLRLKLEEPKKIPRNARTQIKSSTD